MKDKRIPGRVCPWCGRLEVQACVRPKAVKMTCKYDCGYYAWYQIRELTPEEIAWLKSDEE